MKKYVLIILFLVFSFHSIKGQIPDQFNYQGVLRNSSNELITNTNIGIRVGLIEGSSSGNEVYTETHTVKTNNYGQFTVQVGKGEVTSGNFTNIDWASGQIFLKISVDENGDANYTDLPVVQLITVPYALYANEVINKDDADADPNNELQQLSFKNDSVFISGGNGINLPYDSSNWVINGNTMYYNGGNVGIGSSTPVSNLEVKANSGGTDALFQVINANNDTVFAVYPDGVKIYVDQNAKGKVGGFAISGRSPNKASDVDILKVTMDSTRIYVSDTVSNKGKVGGFAISGRSPNKGTATDYMRITRDSTRIYVTEGTTKGKVGGFAISGRSPNKGIGQDYFNVSGNTSAEIVNNESRVMWYPKKAALLAGEVHVGSADSVGTNSSAIGYRNIAMGNYSQAMGYNAKAFGNNSTAIGNNASVDSSNAYAFGNNTYAGGKNSYALGDSAYVSKTNSYAIGAGAKATGDYSFAVGSQGVDYVGDPTGKTIASGEYSYAFGMGSEASGQGAFAFGTNTISSSYYSMALGYKTQATGSYSTSMGYNSSASGFYSTATGIFTEAIGVSSTAMGYYANAIGNYSVAMGEYAKASSDYSLAIGWGGVASYTEASGQYSVALGYNTLASGNYSFASGRMSEASGTYSTAMGDNSTSSGGYASVAMGFSATSTASASVALGLYPTSEGQAAFAAGNHAKASSNSAISLGDYTNAQGKYAFAGGNRTEALGENSTAFGRNSLANGVYSTAMGLYTIANSYGEFAIGMYNDTLNASNRNSRVATDALFIIGNGTLTTNRSNAFTVLKNGNTGIGGFPTTTGENVFSILNGTAPSASVAGGIQLYSEDVIGSAELKVRDEAGNITTLSPHNFTLTQKSEPMAWSFYSENKNAGYKINVDMLKAIRKIEELTGEKLVYMQDLKTKKIVQAEKSEESLVEIVDKQQLKINKLEQENEELKQKLDEIMQLLKDL